jgi:CheY-like chemotaxis protein
MFMPGITNQPQRILIVEQNGSIRDLLHIFLEQEGYETELAASLDEAFTKVDEALFNLVVMDPFALPNQPRLAAARRLKQRCIPTPVGVITGWQIPSEEAERAGFAFLMQKPFNLEDLLQRIASRLDQPFTPEQQQQASIIRQAMAAMSAGDWEALRALCMPTICYYPLTRSIFMPERALIGIEAFLAYAQLVRQQLPDLQIKQMVIFPHTRGLMARYNIRWQGHDNRRPSLSGTAICRFRGERLSQIAISLPTQRLRALLERPSQQAGL